MSRSCAICTMRTGKSNKRFIDDEAKQLNLPRWTWIYRHFAA
jgi:hypothetical protein